MAEIVQLTNADDQEILPVTNINAVYNDNGKPILKNCIFTGEESEEFDATLNADTLGGKSRDEYDEEINTINQNLTDLMEGGVYEFSANGQNQTFTVNFQKTHKVEPKCVQLTVQRLSTSNVLTCTCELESMGNESFIIHVKGSNGLGYRINWLAYFG